MQIPEDNICKYAFMLICLAWHCRHWKNGIILVVLVPCTNLPNMLSYYIVTCHLHPCLLLLQLNMYNIYKLHIYSTFQPFRTKPFILCSSCLCFSLTHSHQSHNDGDRAVSSQGRFNVWTEGSWDRTINPTMNASPALPPEPQPLKKLMFNLWLLWKKWQFR